MKFILVVFLIFGASLSFSPKCLGQAKHATVYNDTTWIKKVVSGYMNGKLDAPPPLKFKTKKAEKRWLDKQYQRAAVGSIERAALAYYSGLHFDGDEAVRRLMKIVNMRAIGTSPIYGSDKSDPFVRLPDVLKDIYAKTKARSALRAFVETNMDGAPGELFDAVRFPMFLESPAIFVPYLSNSKQRGSTPRLKRNARGFTDMLIFWLPDEKDWTQKPEFWLKHYSTATTESERFLHWYFAELIKQSSRKKKTVS